MTLYKRDTKLQKVAMVSSVFRCESCGHVETSSSGDSSAKCPACGSSMSRVGASAEESEGSDETVKRD